MKTPADDGMGPGTGARRPDAGRTTRVRRSRAAMMLAGLAVACGLIAGLLAWKIVPPRYEAQARLQVSGVRPRLIFSTPERKVDHQAYQRTQMALIRSRTVLNEALKQVGDLPIVREQRNPSFWLEGKIQAGFDGEVFRISMSDDRPEGLAELVNSVKDAYLSMVVHKDERARRERLEQLVMISDQFQARLEHQREALRTLGQAFDTTGEGAGRDARERELESEIEQIEVAAGRIEAEVEALRVELGAPDPVRVIEVAGTPKADHTRQRRVAATAGGSASGVVLVVGLLSSLGRSRRVIPEPPVHGS